MKYQIAMQSPIIEFTFPKVNYHSTLEIPSNELNALDTCLQLFESGDVLLALSCVLSSATKILTVILNRGAAEPLGAVRICGCTYKIYFLMLQYRTLA